MATIRTSIMVNDMMSRQFRAMNMAMSTVISSFEHLQDVSGEAIDVSSLNAAQRELQQVESQFNQIEHEIRQTENAQNRLNNEFREGQSELAQMAGMVAAVGGAYAAYSGAGQLIKTSDEMANIEARLNMVNDGMQTTAELQDMITAAALRSDASFTTMAGNVAKLAMNAKEAFSSTQQAILFAELLNKQFVIAGANTTEIESATLQLTQALASGVLRGEELNAVFEAAPNIVRRIADYMGVSIGQIRDMAADGEVTADIVTAAILSSANEINRQFDSMGTNYQRMWQNFKTYAILAFEPVTDKLNEIANSQKFQQMVTSLIGVMILFANILYWVLDVSYTTLTFMYDHWSSLAPVIFGVGGAIIALVTMIGILKAAMWSYAIVQAIVAATNPFMLIVVVIILLIGLYYAVINAINQFAGTSISATGIVAGAFMFLYAHIYNIIAYLWNAFASLAEFFVNVWNYPIYSAKKLFYNLASNVLDHTLSMSRGWDSFATGFVNAIIWAVNGAIKAWNWFVDLLPDEIASKIGLETAGTFSARTSITSDIGKIKGYLNDWVGEAPTGYWEAPKMDFKSYSDSWNTGYNWGANLFDFNKIGSDFLNIDDLLSKSSAIQDAMAGIKDAIDSGNAAGKDTAGNTKKLADSADMLEEDLAYLREQVASNLQNLYKNTNIKVDMKNENHINNGLDIDGVIDRFGEKVEEVAETLAEGDDIV